MDEFIKITNDNTLDPSQQLLLNKKSLRHSNLLKNIYEEFYPTDKLIILSEIPIDILTHIIEFLNYYSDCEPIEVKKPLPIFDISKTYGEWPELFMNKLSDNKLLLLLKAADYIDCKALIELTSSKIACIISELNGNEMMEYFGLKEDITDIDEFDGKMLDDKKEKISSYKDNTENCKFNCDCEEKVWENFDDF